MPRVTFHPLLLSYASAAKSSATTVDNTNGKTPTTANRISELDAICQPSRRPKRNYHQLGVTQKS